MSRQPDISPPALEVTVLAPELPPGTGGMERLAAGLILALEDHPGVGELRVVTQVGVSTLDDSLSGVQVEHHPLIEASLKRTAAQLEALPIPDVWLALNAGLAPLASRLPGRFSLYVHGNDFLRPWIACGPSLLERIKWPYVALVRHALRRRNIARALADCALLMANSGPTSESLKTLDPRSRSGGQELEIEVVPPGIADSWFARQLPSGEGSGRRPFRLLTVARLARATRRKNVDGLLRAIALVVGEGVDVQLRVVGDGDDQSRLVALASELGVSARVDFLGRLDDPHLHAEYSSADLFVLASRAEVSDVEGFGMVYVEAAACGTPSLALRAGGAVDAVAEGLSGFFVDSPEAPALAATIASLVQQEAAAKEDWPRPSDCRDHARRFRWPGIADQVVRGLRRATAR